MAADAFRQLWRPWVAGKESYKLVSPRADPAALGLGHPWLDANGLELQT